MNAKQVAVIFLVLLLSVMNTEANGAPRDFGDSPKKESRSKKDKPMNKPSLSIHTIFKMDEIARMDKSSGDKKSIPALYEESKRVHVFTDDYVTVAIRPTPDRIELILNNTGKETATILWSECALVLMSGKVVKAGLGSEPPVRAGTTEKSIVPIGGSIEESIYPVEALYHSRLLKQYCLMSMYPSEYSTGDLAFAADKGDDSLKKMSNESREEIEARCGGTRGKKMVLLLTLESGNKKLEYTCPLEVADVVISESTAPEK